MLCISLAFAVSLLAWSSQANSVDKCVYLENFDLAAALNSKLSISSIPEGYGTISQCLCISGIDNLIGQNHPATMAVDYTSMSDVVDAVAEIIDSASGHQSCNYPSNSQPTCTQDNVCGFNCRSGFQLSGNDCVCSPAACPSGVVRKRSEDLQLTMGRHLCPMGQEACGGYSGPKSYECIDTRRTLDSCGGCVFPIPGRKAGGMDCSAITGAENVRCVDSKCVVMRCMAGLNVTADAQACGPS